MNDNSGFDDYQQLKKRIEYLENRIRICELYNDELDAKVRLLEKRSPLQRFKRYRWFNILYGMAKDPVWAKQIVLKALANPRAALRKVKKKVLKTGQSII